MENKQENGLLSRLRRWSHHHTLKLFPYIPYNQEIYWLEILDSYPEFVEGTWEAEYCSLSEADIFMIWGPLNPKQWASAKKLAAKFKSNVKIYLFWNKGRLELPSLTFNDLKDDALFFRSFSYDEGNFVEEVVKQLQNHKNLIKRGEIDHV